MKSGFARKSGCLNYEDDNSFCIIQNVTKQIFYKNRLIELSIDIKYLNNGFK